MLLQWATVQSLLLTCGGGSRAGRREGRGGAGRAGDLRLSWSDRIGRWAAPLAAGAARRGGIQSACALGCACAPAALSSVCIRSAAPAPPIAHPDSRELFYSREHRLPIGTASTEYSVLYSTPAAPCGVRYCSVHAARAFTARGHLPNRECYSANGARLGSARLGSARLAALMFSSAALLGFTRGEERGEERRGEERRGEERRGGERARASSPVHRSFRKPSSPLLSSPLLFYLLFSSWPNLGRNLVRVGVWVGVQSLKIVRKYLRCTVL